MQVEMNLMLQQALSVMKRQNEALGRGIPHRRSVYLPPGSVICHAL